MTSPLIISSERVLEALEEIPGMLERYLVSPRVPDDGGLEPANLVDTSQRAAEGCFEIAAAIDRHAAAIDGLAEAIRLKT